MFLLAQTTAMHAAINHNELQISVQDVRMALQDCAALAPENVFEDGEFDGEEDMRGVEDFIGWITGKVNREIRRIALDGDDGKEDYLAGMAPLTLAVFLSDFS
jgi:transcription initiation factor TFIID subunit 3